MGGRTHKREVPEKAAHELFSIGVRTRGAIRTRGTVHRAARSRFPPGTDTKGLLRRFQAETGSEVRIAVASALGEWYGEEALPILTQWATGPESESNTGVRASAIEAIGVIGGLNALKALERTAETDPDPTVQSVAVGWIASLGKRESAPAVHILETLQQKLPEGIVRKRTLDALNLLRKR